MSDFTKPPILFPPLAVLSTTNLSHCPAGFMVIAAGSTISTSIAWGTANLGVYIPVWLSTAVTIFKLSTMNGATAAGNTDIGIYNEDGTRLVSSGPTLQVGTSTIQTFDVTDTVLNPGVYFLALASTDATATFLSSNTVSTPRMRACGCLQETGLSSGTLAASATFATYAQTFVPTILAHTRSVV